MGAPTRIWLPVEKATIDETYMGYKIANEPNGMHLCEIKYKGNGIGWVWNDEKNKVENITELERYTTFQEVEEWYKARFDLTDTDTQLNLYGLFEDLYSVGDAHREMWNAWIGLDFYELNENLKENGMILIGIAPAPFEWSMGEECCAYIAEFKDTGERIWCHGAKHWVDDMRTQMTEFAPEKFQN